VIEFDVFKKKDPSPDMTPMLDMVFLLLIFFLLTSVFRSTAIVTDLPSSTTSKLQNDKPIIVSVKHGGEIFLNDKRMDKNELTAALTCELERKGTKEISIASDRNVDFENIVSVMDIAGNAGAQSVSFLTDHAEE
jgi:biopolymer transport protein ExbD